MDELDRHSVEKNLESHLKRQGGCWYLDNVRSGNNVGSILRTADAIGGSTIASTFAA